MYYVQDVYNKYVYYRFTYFIFMYKVTQIIGIFSYALKLRQILTNFHTFLAVRIKKNVQ